MKNVKDELSLRIQLLESQQSQEIKALKEHIHQMYDSLKPINIIKSTFSDLLSTEELKDNMLDNAIGLSTGYFSKKIIFGSSSNPIKNILGNVVQFAIGSVASKHSDTVKAIGEVFLSRIFKKTSTLENSITSSVASEMQKSKDILTVLKERV